MRRLPTELIREADAGIATIPDNVVGHTGLVEVLSEWRLPQRGGLYVIFSSAKHLSATVRRFQNHLIAEFRDFPGA